MELPTGRDLGIQEFGHSPPTPWVLVLFVSRGVFLSFSQGGFADGTLVPGGSWIGVISLCIMPGGCEWKTPVPRVAG